jgi:hypothetical protein
MIKQFSLSLFFAAVSLCYANAQNTFFKSLKTNGPATGQSVLQVNGGYIVAGVSANAAEDSNYVFILKTDTAGDTLWTRTYRLKKIFHILSNSAIQQTADGGFILTGFSRNTNQMDSLVIMRTDSIGNVLWTNLIGELNTELAGESIQPTPDGGFIITGMYYKMPGALYILLMKLNSAGTTVWSKAITVDYDGEGTCVRPTSDGGYIITGQANYRIFLVKTNGTGNVTWSTLYPTAAPYDVAYSVVEASNGDYVVCGTNTIDTTGASRIILFKTNVNGDTLWSHNYFGASSFVTSSAGADLVNTADGGFAICGFVTQMDDGSNYTCLLKTDSMGILEWSRTYGAATGTNIGSHSLEQTADGGYVITGDAEDITLVKTDSLGRTACSDSGLTIITTPTTILNAFGIVYDSIISCGTSSPAVLMGKGLSMIDCSEIGIDESEMPVASFSIYPNPAHSSFTVSLNKNLRIREAELKIFDITGRVVLEQILNTQSTIIDIKSTVGIYVVKLSSSVNSSVQKLVVE